MKTFFKILFLCLLGYWGFNYVSVQEKLVNDFYSKEDSPISSKNPQIKKVLILLTGSNAYKE